VTAAAGLEGEPSRLLDHLVSVTEHARYARRSEHLPRLRQDTELFRSQLLRSRPLRRQVRAFLWPVALSDVCATAAGKVTDALERLDQVEEHLRAWERRLTVRTKRPASQKGDR
jgi:hypothetical protein